MLSLSLDFGRLGLEFWIAGSEVESLELPCAGLSCKLFNFYGLRLVAQFLPESLCDLHFGTVQAAQVGTAPFAPVVVQGGWGRGTVPSLNETARIREDSGRLCSADYECGINDGNFTQTFWSERTVRKDNGL